ncbi:MAG: hypothetical protein N3A38_13045 [Planctomycetota bacterium]|nr:hypothetical protein [Planctomycetota bacterium]
MRSAAGVALVCALALIAGGCTVQESYFQQQDQYFKPEGKRAVGRDGYVGAVWRVPAGDEGEGLCSVVVALGPMTYRPAEPGFGDVWKVSAVFEFRNRLPEPVTFLPGSIRLNTGKTGDCEPAAVTRLGDPAKLSGPVEVLDYSRACFVATWLLRPAEVEQRGGFTFLPSRWPGRFGQVAITWGYKYAGRDYLEKSVFKPTDSALAERSLALKGREVLAADVIYPDPEDVPFLSAAPGIGPLIPETAAPARKEVRLSHNGVWWPLEGKRSGCICQ